MKSTILNIKKRVLVVEIPRLHGYNCYGDKMVIHNELNNPIHFIDGKWDFICGGSELSEEIAKNYALKSMNQHWRNLNRKKEDFSDLWLNSALDSFISEIEANGFTWGNPMGAKPLYATGQGDKKLLEMVAEGYLKSWEEAESKTFHPDRTLIFEIL